MGMWIDEVRGMLVGKTIVGVEEVQTDGIDRITDEDAVTQEGIELLLDDGSRAEVLVDYEKLSMIVRHV